MAMERLAIPLAFVLACEGGRSEPAPPSDPPLAADVEAPPDRGDATAIAPTVLERFPALAVHPGVTPRLLDALATDAPARERLIALAESLAPFRWDSATSWDNAGFVALGGPVTGFVTQRAGEVVAQTPGSFDLGCAGGFLEGVRVTLLPTLELAELAACDPGLAERVRGAPGRCDDPGDFGLRAIANIAARLDAARLPDGATVVEIAPDDAERLALLRAAGAAHLCTVSHVSVAHAGRRYHHHMMIVMATDDGAAYDVFDTTGSRGVAVQRMQDDRLRTYARGLLAANREYRYAPASARINCVRVVLRTR